MQHEPGDAYETLVQFLYRAPIGLAQTTLDGTVEMLNPMASNLLMPLATDAGLDNLFDLLAPVAPQLPAMVEAFIEPSGMICEGLRLPVGVHHAASGSLQVLSLNLTKLDPERLMATVADATFEVQREQEMLSRRLRSAARTDSLTRMPNRAAVRDELQRLLARPQDGLGFAVLTLNCDRFRQLNDSLGQAGGDQLLMHIADRLRGALRPPTTMIEPAARSGQLAARIGGDEFVVVLDGLRARHDAERVALRLLEALAHPYVIGGHEIVCSASLGLAWGPDAAALDMRDEHDPDSLLATPASRWSRPSAPAATGMPCSKPACASARRGAPTSRPTCARPWPRNSCSWSTSRWCACCRTAASIAPPGSRRWCAGAIRSAASCRRSNSSRWQKSAA